MLQSISIQTGILLVETGFIPQKHQLK